MKARLSKEEKELLREQKYEERLMRKLREQEDEMWYWKTLNEVYKIRDEEEDWD